MPLHATCILLLTKLYIVSSMYATTCNMYPPPHKAIYSVIHVCHRYNVIQCTVFLLLRLSNVLLTCC